MTARVQSRVHSVGGWGWRREMWGGKDGLMVRMVRMVGLNQQQDGNKQQCMRVSVFNCDVTVL